MPTTATATKPSARRRTSSAHREDEAPIIPILARKVREVEAKAQRGKLGPTNRVKFQVIAFLVREERARVKADTDLADGVRAELLKRLDGVATILAKTAARDTSLIQLLEADHKVFESKIYDNAPGGHVFLHGDTPERADAYRRIFDWLGKYLQ